MAKTETLNIALTDEMKKFVSKQSGRGTLYATPSEYVRDLIRHEKDQVEADKIRNAILEGYHDIANGRFHQFSGDLMHDLKAYKEENLS
jgi:antitoxin ParD1/3/4